jgi:hypothetical protein
MNQPETDAALMQRNLAQIAAGDMRALRVSAEHYAWLSKDRLNWEARTTVLLNLIERCRIVLGNMALENDGAKRFFSRWQISDEPLRNDAKNLLPLIDAEISK